MQDFIDRFLACKASGCEDTAAALLVLAAAVEGCGACVANAIDAAASEQGKMGQELAEAVRASSTFSSENTENFGHALELVLKNVLTEGKLDILAKVELGEYCKEDLQEVAESVKVRLVRAED